MLRIRFTGRAGSLALALLLVASGVALAGSLDGAKRALEKGEFEQAAAQYLKACKQSTPAREAVLGLAEATYRGKLDDDYLFESEEALDRLLDKNEQDADANLLQGDVYLLKASRQRDPQMLRGYYEDARARFSRALAARPASEQAVTGIAKALYFQGDFSGAEDALGAYLAGHPKDVARAQFWRGQAIFVQAGDAYRKAGAMTDPVKKLYAEAQQAYAASTIADPSSYEAWVQLAYAAQWSQDFVTARKAYLSAVAADKTGKEIAALKGLASIHAHEPEKYTETLAELAKAHPKHEQVLLYAIANFYGRKRDDEAKALIAKFLKVADNPAPGHFYAGQIAERAGDAKAAISEYAKALATQPDYSDPAWAWSELLISSKDLPQRIGSWDKARVLKLVADYQPLFRAAPGNVWPRNSLGFSLREFYGAHSRRGADSAWEPILKESVKAYVSAAEIIGEYDPANARNLPFRIRYGYAQVVSDTGLMFQFYAATKDWKKAETYYLNALEWSDQGYFDAWNNLRQIYTAEERFEDLYDLASLCAEGLVHEDKRPNAEGRAQATATMKQLEASGKVSGN